MSTAKVIQNRRLFENYPKLSERSFTYTGQKWV